MRRLDLGFVSLAAGLLALSPPASAAGIDAAGSWKLGTPIVTYWAGPSMTEAVAAQMAEGSFNLVWCTEKELDIVQRHRLRAQLQDALLTPASLESPAEQQKLDALLERVRSHPALYSYFIIDEPNATNFLALGKLVAYLRGHDPMHLAYINLFPTYATNEQLGNRGDTTTAYRAHLLEYVDKVQPALISYDHYQFTTKGDSDQYFLNLALIRQAAQDAGLPFLNIVQAATWTPSMRVPNADEMRYLVYTTLAYGAQGISYYVYSCAGHTGGIANADGTPTPLYHALKSLNREFVAIATQLRGLSSLGVYHAGTQPPGSVPLPDNVPLTLDPPLPALGATTGEKTKGLLLGYFGRRVGKTKDPNPTHVLVVNLDYKTNVVLGLRASGRLKLFDATTRQWLRSAKLAVLHLPPGGGTLVRLAR